MYIQSVTWNITGFISCFCLNVTDLYRDKTPLFNSFSLNIIFITNCLDVGLEEQNNMELKTIEIIIIIFKEFQNTKMLHNENIIPI